MNENHSEEGSDLREMENDDTQRILRERALALSSESAPDKPGDALEVVEFVLGQERYAVESRFVREVQTLTHLTPVPCTPDFVLGVVNIRGEVVSVIDVARFFGLPRRGLGDLNRIVLLRDEEMSFGILADVLLGMRKVPAGEIQRSLPTMAGPPERYLRGVAPGPTTIIDGGKLLADDSIVVEEQVVS